METKQFRDDAKDGGCVFADAMFENDLFMDGDMYQLLLMPEAWQAVGKTRGWIQRVCDDCGGLSYKVPHPKGYWQCECSDYFVGTDEWEYKWHRFIDHLAVGKTIEEALTAIK